MMGTSGWWQSVLVNRKNFLICELWLTRGLLSKCLSLSFTVWVYIWYLIRYQSWKYKWSIFKGDLNTPLIPVLKNCLVLKNFCLPLQSTPAISTILPSAHATIQARWAQLHSLYDVNLLFWVTFQIKKSYSNSYSTSVHPCVFRCPVGTRIVGSWWK